MFVYIKLQLYCYDSVSGGGGGGVLCIRVNRIFIIVDLKCRNAKCSRSLDSDSDLDDTLLNFDRFIVVQENRSYSFVKFNNKNNDRRSF